jgi:hypothetical protein
LPRRDRPPHFLGMAPTAQYTRKAIARFYAVVTAPNREQGHELLSQIAIMVGILDRPDRWVSAIVRLRKDRAISPNESVYFLSLLLDQVIEEARTGDPVLLGLRQRERTIESLHDVAEGAAWPGDPPPEYRQLQAWSSRRLDEIVANYLRDQGACDAAHLLVSSRQAFDEAGRQGRAEFDRRWPSHIDRAH